MVSGSRCAQGAVIGTAALAGFRELLRNRQWQRRLQEEQAAHAGRARSILITGAASGVGLETARLFAARGWFVGMYDINDELLARSAESVESVEGSAGVSHLRLDLTDRASCEAAMQHFLSATEDGRLDCLFNCAGLLQVGLFDELELEPQLAQNRVNIDGLITMTYVALPALKKTPFSRIVNMASKASFYGAPSHAVYSATKHAVRALTEAWSIELERFNIGVTDVSVGYIATPMVLEQRARDFKTIQDESTFLTAQYMAGVIWQAATEDPRKVHFNADASTAIAARLIDLIRLLDIRCVRSLFADMMLPDRAKHSSKL